MSGMDHINVSFMMRTATITCRDRPSACQPETVHHVIRCLSDKRTIPLPLFSLSLSRSLSFALLCSGHGVKAGPPPRSVFSLSLSLSRSLARSLSLSLSLSLALSLSLSLSLVSACSSAVLQCVHVMSQLYHLFRQIIVLEKTPVILACPAQPATILPAHAQARPTFAAPITLATLRISRCQQTQRMTMIRILQSYHATATMSPISQDLQAQVHRPCHVRARHQSRYHQRSADSG